MKKAILTSLTVFLSLTALGSDALYQELDKTTQITEAVLAHYRSKLSREEAKKFKPTDAEKLQLKKRIQENYNASLKKIFTDSQIRYFGSLYKSPLWVQFYNHQMNFISQEGPQSIKTTKK